MGVVVPTLLEDRAPNQEVTIRVVADGNGGRRRFSLSGIVSTIVVGALAVGVLLIAGVITGFLHVGNPFATSTIDRTPPALLRQLNNLSQYDAARGKFQSTLDVEDDVAILPSFIAGERTVFLAQGSVDATVDFSSLSKDAVQRNANGSVTVTLPEPRLGEAVVDPKTSHVISRDRGLVNRVADAFSNNPGSEHRFFVLAQTKLHRAAEQSHLVDRAEQNTTKMLQGFLGKLGYSNVKIVFGSPHGGRTQT